MTSGTYIAYLHLCHRKLWLHAHGMKMENASQNQYVAEGKLISETSYARRPSRWRELDLGHIKIDHFDPDTNTVREVKKSAKLEHAHIAQVKYYLYTLERNGMKDVKGLIEYPKQRKTQEVLLTDEDRRIIPLWEKEILEITSREACPPLVKKPYCRTCAFREFCYV